MTFKVEETENPNCVFAEGSASNLDNACVQITLIRNLFDRDSLFVLGRQLLRSREDEAAQVPV